MTSCFVHAQDVTRDVIADGTVVREESMSAKFLTLKAE